MGVSAVTAGQAAALRTTGQLTRLETRPNPPSTCETRQWRAAGGAAEHVNEEEPRWLHARSRTRTPLTQYESSRAQLAARS